MESLRLRRNNLPGISEVSPATFTFTDMLARLHLLRSLGALLFEEPPSRYVIFMREVTHTHSNALSERGVLLYGNRVYDTRMHDILALVTCCRLRK